MGGLGLAVRAREALRGPGLHARQGLGIGIEERVHRCLVLRAQLRVAPVAVAEALAHRGVVGHVARGLLQVGGEPAALEHLRHHVRDPLARDVRAAELRHRVVAVADEDALVELAGALALLTVEGGARRGVRGELLEVEPPQRSLVARVAREQGALHRLGQVHEREDGRVEVGEMGGEEGALLVREGLDRVVHRGRAPTLRGCGVRGGPRVCSRPAAAPARTRASRCARPPAPPCRGACPCGGRRS